MHRSVGGRIVDARRRQEKKKKKVTRRSNFVNKNEDWSEGEVVVTTRSACQACDRVFVCVDATLLLLLSKNKEKKKSISGHGRSCRHWHDKHGERPKRTRRRRRRRSPTMIKRKFGYIVVEKPPYEIRVRRETKIKGGQKARTGFFPQFKKGRVRRVERAHVKIEKIMSDECARLCWCGARLLSERVFIARSLPRSLFGPRYITPRAFSATLVS